MNELMPGVNILNTVEVDRATSIFLWIILIAISVSIGVLGVIAFCNDRKSKDILVFAIVMFLASVAEVDGCVRERIPDIRYYKSYSVTIDENVSFKELYEKYEVIKVEGQIYTLKERD